LPRNACGGLAGRPFRRPNVGQVVNLRADCQSALRPFRKKCHIILRSFIGIKNRSQACSMPPIPNAKPATDSFSAMPATLEVQPGEADRV